MTERLRRITFSLLHHIGFLRDDAGSEVVDVGVGGLCDGQDETPRQRGGQGAVHWLPGLRGASLQTVGVVLDSELQPPTGLLDQQVDLEGGRVRIGPQFILFGVM